jgi:hypothetical protein
MTENNDYITDDKIKENVLIQLLHFYNRGCAVHFSMVWGDWRNAIIRKIDEEKGIVIIKEFVLGNLVINLVDIDPNSIEEYNLNNKEDRK